MRALRVEQSGVCNFASARSWALARHETPASVAAVGMQKRTKHYIAYRLESESDPYRHLRRTSSRTRRRQAGQGEEAEELVSSTPSSFMASWGATDTPEDWYEAQMEQDASGARTASGLGMGGGVVQRSKGGMVTRAAVPEWQQGRPRAGAQESGDRTQSLPTELEGEEGAYQPNAAERHNSDSEHWLPQAVRETGSKVLETVEGAASSVGHTAKQLWDGAVGGGSEHRDGASGVVDTAKGVGKETAHVIDYGYAKALEKAVDKMLEALDVSLMRAKAKGFPAGLTVSSSAAVMGAQLQLFYTTKEEDVVAEKGRMHAGETKPQRRRRTGRPSPPLTPLEDSKRAAPKRTKTSATEKDDSQ